MARIYLYKLTTDNGGAPCIQNELFSLAICKPMIRRTAQVGDLVFGFAANSLDVDNSLIYVARVTEDSPNGEYYRKRRFSSRNDRIYERRGDRLEWRSGALFHGPANQQHDVGEHPAYERARVLLSNDFRYFGSHGTAEYKSRFAVIRGVVESMKQGHRVVTDGPLWEELQALGAELWKETRNNVLGEPTSASQVIGRNATCPAPSTRAHPTTARSRSTRC